MKQDKEALRPARSREWQDTVAFLGWGAASGAQAMLFLFLLIIVFANRAFWETDLPQTFRFLQFVLVAAFGFAFLNLPYALIRWLLRNKPWSKARKSLVASLLTAAIHVSPFLALVLAGDFVSSEYFSV